MANNELRIPYNNLYEIKKKCNCGGEYVYQYSVTQLRKKYIHQCNKCNNEKGFDTKYPYIAKE